MAAVSVWLVVVGVACSGHITKGTWLPPTKPDCPAVFNHPCYT